jgi:hypothetical protein
MTAAPVKLNPLAAARQRYILAVGAFLTKAAEVEADPEAIESLAKAFDSEAQWFESLSDGKSWISKTGWMDYLYKDVTNTNRGGIMVPSEKRLIEIDKPSKKGAKKVTAKLLKDLKDEHYVVPHIAQSEIFFVKYMQLEKALKHQAKREKLSEAAFGTSKYEGPGAVKLEEEPDLAAKEWGVKLDP